MNKEFKQTVFKEHIYTKEQMWPKSLWKYAKHYWALMEQMQDIVRHLLGCTQ